MMPRQARFIQEYLLDLNATQAAIRAGYSAKSAARIGFRLLCDPRVAEAVNNAVEARNRRTEISQDRILEELSRIAFGDFMDIAAWDASGLRLKSSDELTPEQAAAVCEISETSSSTKVKRHDKVKALELLMRHKGMLKDKLQLSGELDLSALEKGRARAKERL